MSHVTLTEEQFRAHRERIGRQMAERETNTLLESGAQSIAPEKGTEKTHAGRNREIPLQEAVFLELPPPVSANRYWRSFVPNGHTRAIVTLSDEAKAYKARVKSIAHTAGIVRPLAGRVEVFLKFYPARPLDWIKRARSNPLDWDDHVRSIDLDNALKVTIDAIENVVIEDDSWIRRIVAERMEPDGESRMLLEVRQIAAPVLP